ncbi:hypothetical protein LINPERHAP2_LOCUS33698 [Linum perenne]
MVSTNGPPSCQKWHPPTPGELTCNVDGALFHDSTQHGAGMLIRREDGSMVKFKMVARQGCPDVNECEARALLDALLWLHELSITRITIKLDSQIVCSDEL